MSAEYAEGSVGGEQACRHWGFADGDEEAARVRAQRRWTTCGVLDGATGQRASRQRRKLAARHRR